MDHPGVARRPVSRAEMHTPHAPAGTTLSADPFTRGPSPAKTRARSGPPPRTGIARSTTASNVSMRVGLFACGLLLLGGGGLAYVLNQDRTPASPPGTSGATEATLGQAVSIRPETPRQLAPGAAGPSQSSELEALRHRAEEAEARMQLAQERAAASQARMAAVEAGLAAERNRTAASSSASSTRQPTASERAAGGNTVILGQGANLREQPQSAADVIRVLPRGTALQIFGRAPGGWYQVGMEEPWGWIHGSRLEEPRRAY
jgi:hypothetical protein